MGNINGVSTLSHVISKKPARKEIPVYIFNMLSTQFAWGYYRWAECRIYVYKSITILWILAWTMLRILLSWLSDVRRKKWGWWFSLEAGRIIVQEVWAYCYKPSWRTDIDCYPFAWSHKRIKWISLCHLFQDKRYLCRFSFYLKASVLDRIN